MKESNPVMYDLSQLQLIDGIRSSFPSWRRSEQFDYRQGWTRMGNFFADGYFTREEMRELVHNQYNVVI